MTDDQLKKLFADNNKALLKELNAQLDQRLEENNAKLFSQIVRHVDKRINSLDDKMTAGFDRVYNTLDGLTKRVDDDDKERAVITHEQTVHGKWIHQLAKTTKTKLVPER